MAAKISNPPAVEAVLYRAPKKMNKLSPLSNDAQYSFFLDPANR